MTLEKLLLKSLKRLAGTKLRHKPFQAGGMSRPRKDGIHGHTRPSTGLSQAARNCQLSCLRHAVMNHLLGSVKGALAADENDPPLPLSHAGKIGATEAHAAEYIDLEESPLFLVVSALSVRPFTMTYAPSAASWRAAAKPMPLVDPEIRAVFLFSSRFIEIIPQ